MLPFVVASAGRTVPPRVRRSARNRWSQRASSLAALLILTAVAAWSSSTGRALALDDGLAATPYMGWTTYLGMGGFAQHTVDEAGVEAAADAMVSRGLAAAGYRYVWLDGGWWNGQRDAGGDMVVDPTAFPDGMAAVVQHIHADGLLAGIYTDAGTNGCGGPGLGSYGHYQQDADQFAAWGFDAVKIDFCGGYRQGLDPQTAYTEFSEAIRDNSSARPMLIELCNPTAGRYGTWRYASDIANSWRTDADIGTYHDVPWSRVLRNVDTDSLHPTAAGPGAWNDPDYLGPEMGMTPSEAQAQFDMWAVLSAPLMVGTDVRTMSDDTVAMLTDPAVIAIDQDTTGGQGTLRSNDHGIWQVWAKPLAGGQLAVVLINRGPGPHTISTAAEKLGLAPASGYSLLDAVTHHATFTTGRIAASVPADSAVMLRVAPDDLARRSPPSVVLDAPQATTLADGQTIVQPGTDDTFVARLRNESATTIRRIRITTSAPATWHATTPAAPTRLAPGAATILTWHAHPPIGATSHPVTISADFVHAAGRAESVSATTTPRVQTLTAVSGTTLLSAVPWLTASSTGGRVRTDSTASGKTLTLGGANYPDGVVAPSVASIEYWLGGGCDDLRATVGIDGSAAPAGSVQLQVWADGRAVYRSPVITGASAPLAIDVPLDHAQSLWLKVSDAGDGSAFDVADFADATLDCR